MATVEKKDNGTWRVRYRDPGAANPRSITCPDEKTARAKAGDVDKWQLFNQGKPYPRHGDGQKPPAGLEDAVVAWLQDKGRTLREATITRMAAEISPYMNWMGDRATLAHVTAASVEKWDAEMMKAGRAPSTRRRVINTIELFARWAAERPDEWPGMSTMRRIDKPKAPPPAVRAPTWAEIDAMILQLQGGGSTFRAALLARYTGLRIQQIVEIQWDHIANGVLTVMHGKSAVEMAARRQIPLAPSLLAEMDKWRRTDARVVPATPSGVRKGIRLAWRKAATAGAARVETFAASEVTGRKNGCPLHGIRKGLVTSLKRAGVDEEAVEYYVGHSLALRGRYLDPASLDLKKLVEAIPAYPVKPEDPADTAPVEAGPDINTREDVETVNNVLHFLTMTSKQTR